MRSADDGKQMLPHLLLNISALRAAGTVSPAGSPYHVGVIGTTKNHRNGIIEKSVSQILVIEHPTPTL